MTAAQSPVRASLPSRTLWRISWRYLLRHPWQTVLMVLGITLGVAVAVSVDLANVSAGRAFDLSATAVTGAATHQITGGPQGIPESVYTSLRLRDVAPLAPVVSEYASSPQLGGIPMQLLGIDPFAEAPFRSYLYDQGGLQLAGLSAFFVQPGAVLISSGVAQRYGLAAGDAITLTLLGAGRPARIAGLLRPNDAVAGRLLDNVILADIATVQELTGRLGRIDRIDVLAPGSAPGAVDRLRALLPPSLQMMPAEARSGAVDQMTSAFRINLTALSLLALLVGTFLIYNTMTFSVVQRRPLFGTLRCLGVTRREVFALVVGEALLVGVIGAALGLGLGIVLGQGSVRLVTQTINDLYFVVNVRQVDIPFASLVKGIVLGIVATVVSAAPPAWEAASVPPRMALSRSGLESKAQRAVLWAAAAGVAALLLGVLLLALPTRSLIVSFAGTFAAVLGAAMLTPVAMTVLMRLAGRVTGRLWGALGRMAPRNVANALSRTSVAIAALMIAVSVAIGVSVMVSSFRFTVTTWLEQILQGDIYISAPSVTSTQSLTALAPGVLPIVQQWPGVERVDTLRSAVVESPIGPINIYAIGNPDFARERSYVAADGDADALTAALRSGAVLVSEPFASRVGLPRRGGSVTLQTEQGARAFPVAGIYYDYTSSQGIVGMTIETYRRWWNDDALTALAVRVQPGADADAIQAELRKALAPEQHLFVRPNRALRSDVLDVFDRTFAITSALQMLATLVAFIGVLSALLSMELEKQRELGILRAVGLTARQLWGMLLLETGLMGMVAGVLAMPTGLAISLILVYIINSRSFGWTLQMRLEPWPFVLALLVAVVAAMLASIYPARRMAKTLTAEALRYE